MEIWELGRETGELMLSEGKAYFKMLQTHEEVNGLGQRYQASPVFCCICCPWGAFGADYSLGEQAGGNGDCAGAKR